MVSDQPLGAGDEVIKRILLLQLRAGKMPALAVLTTAAEVRLDKDAAKFEPDRMEDGEMRRETDIKSAVSVHQNRLISIKLRPAPASNEHRHFRAVLASGEGLDRFVRV